MKKVVLICAGGMSSSVVAKKLDERLQQDNISCAFSGCFEARKLIADRTFDVYLESPQVRMYHGDLQKEADASGAILVQIPPLDFAPVPGKIENIRNLVLSILDDSKE